MNIQQFEYVLAVVDLRNFEAAAERCFVTQSTLSTMIGRLEEELDVKIFNRKTKPVSITDEGESIIHQLRIIRHEIDGLNNMVREMKGEMTGTIRLGIIPTIAPYLLPLFLADFARAYPGVHIQIKEMTTAEIMHDLHTRTLDLGILATPLLDNGLLELPLYAEPFLVYDCRKGQPKCSTSMQQIDYNKLWLLQEGHCLRTQVDQLCELSAQQGESRPNFEFESASMDSLLRFTRANKGMTVIPYLASYDLGTSVRESLKNTKTMRQVRSVGLVSHQYYVKKGLMNALQQHIQGAVAPLLPVASKQEVVVPV